MLVTEIEGERRMEREREENKIIDGTGVGGLVERSKERREKRKKEECWTISTL